MIQQRFQPKDNLITIILTILKFYSRKQLWKLQEQ
jgi:hypothetical protein